MTGNCINHNKLVHGIASWCDVVVCLGLGVGTKYWDMISQMLGKRNFVSDKVASKQCGIVKEAESTVQVLHRIHACVYPYPSINEIELWWHRLHEHVGLI